MKPLIISLFVIVLGAIAWSHHGSASKEQGEVANEPRVASVKIESPRPRAETKLPDLSPSRPSKPSSVTGDSKASSQRLELTAEQESSLSESQAREEEWGQRREDLVKNQLGLSPDQIDAIERLRRQTEITEKALIEKPGATREEHEAIRARITANRRNYASGLARILGDRQKDYLAFYREFWGLKPDVTLDSPRFPL